MAAARLGAIFERSDVSTAVRCLRRHARARRQALRGVRGSARAACGHGSPRAAAPGARRRRRAHAADGGSGPRCASWPSRSTSSSSCSRRGWAPSSRASSGGLRRASWGGPSLAVPGLLVAAALTQWLVEGRSGATVGNALTGIRTMGSGTHRPAGIAAIGVRVLVELAGALVAVVGAWVVASSGTWDRSPGAARVARQGRPDPGPAGALGPRGRCRGSRHRAGRRAGPA